MMTTKDEWKFWISLLVLLFSGVVIIRGLVVLFGGDSTDAGLSDALIGFLFFGVIFIIAGRIFLKVSFKYGAVEEASAANEDSAEMPPQTKAVTKKQPKNADWRFLDYSGSAGMAERLESAFQDDPRAFNVSCGTGYPYTTGESSGNSEECEREGVPEMGVFSMKYEAKHEEAINDIYQQITVASKDLVRVTLHQPGRDRKHKTLSDLASRYRQDKRTFNVELSSERSDAPEKNSWDHSLSFSFHRLHLDNLKQEIEEGIKDEDPPINMHIETAEDRRQAS